MAARLSTVVWHTIVIASLGIGGLARPLAAQWIDAAGRVSLVAGSTQYPPGYASDGDVASRWITQSPGGFGTDYFTLGPEPVLVLDLGSDVTLSGVVFNGYGISGPDNNSARSFSLRFATSAEGSDHIGQSIPYRPLFEVENLDHNTPQVLAFDRIVEARYVEVTFHDNYYDPARPQLGGDRVGCSEIRFNTALPNRPRNPTRPTGPPVSPATWCCAGEQPASPTPAAPDKSPTPMSAVTTSTSAAVNRRTPNRSSSRQYPPVTRPNPRPGTARSA